MNGSKKTKYEYNPAHAIGTCGDCGKEMAYNVPRLGPNGGFVHADTGQLSCGPYKPIEIRLLTPEEEQQILKK